MKHRAIEAVEADLAGRRDLADALGASDVAINHYRLEPGEGFPSGLHAHADQEELFVVLDGEATFEVLGRAAVGTPAADDSLRESGEVTVAAGEAIRFERGEFQSGRNAGDADLVALAIGAPRDSDDVRLPAACPDCGRNDLRLETDDGLAFACPDCGLDRAPAPCPDCGTDALQFALGDCGDCGNSGDSDDGDSGDGGDNGDDGDSGDGVDDGDAVVACRECDATFAEPPLK